MSKVISEAVLISINPVWCQKIASGTKTIELRKKRPKIQTPFKCYIYETKGKCAYPQFVDEEGHLDFSGRGQVIGEFICDRIIEDITVEYDPKGFYKFDGRIAEVIHHGMIWPQDLYHYLGGKPCFGWHISDLVIYDKPRELRGFCKAGFSSKITLTRPPQSWCYVEEI